MLKNGKDLTPRGTRLDNPADQRAMLDHKERLRATPEQRLDRAEVALREAALAWAKATTRPPSDSRDSVFKKVDQRLQHAAVAYTHAAGEQS